MIKKILLYNCFHLGDIFFSQPIVRQLCMFNPHIEFTLAIKYCSYLFCEIPNLKIIIIDKNDRLEQHHNASTYFVVDKGTIAINLWIFAIAQNSWDLCHFIEVSLPNMQKQFFSIIKKINREYDVRIYFPLFDLPSLLPVLPSRTDISRFQDWLTHSKYKQTILYFNYRPMSGQKVPVDDHDSVILSLSSLFPENAIIVPKISDTLRLRINQDHENIIDAEHILDCIQIEPTCEHLCKLGKITLFCSYAIIFDIGACYFHVNNQFLQSKVNIIHVSPTSNFFDKIKSHWKNLSTGRMRLLEAENQDQVLEKLKTMIQNHSL